MQKPKAFWVIGGSMMQEYMVKEVLKKNLLPIVSDDDVECVCNKRGDCLFVHADTYDIYKHIEEANNLRDIYDIVGVSTCGADVGRTVSAVANILGLPSASMRQSRIINNKFYIRNCLFLSGKENNPDFYQRIYLKKDFNFEDFSRSIPKTILFPFIVKPLQQRASRGVTIVRQEQDLLQAYERLRTTLDDTDYSAGATFIVEKFHVGTEHSAELIIDNDFNVVFFNIVDRYFDYSTNVPIEIGHLNPSNISNEKYKEIFSMMNKFSENIRLRNSVLKFDLLINQEDGRVIILEGATRLSGGFDCQETTPLSSDRNPVKTMVEIAINGRIDVAVSVDCDACYVACAALIISKKSYFTDISAVKEFARKCGVRHFGYVKTIIVKDNCEIMDQEHNANRLGFVFFYSYDAKAAWIDARNFALDITENIMVNKIGGITYVE